MRAFLKSLLYKIAPRLSTGFFAGRSRAHSQKIIASWGNAAVATKLKEKFGFVVQEGPFAGLTLTPMCEAEQFGPYLLGVYESELDDAWQIVLSRDHSQIIDVGAKIGFYAVGLAKRFPNAKVLAFDADPWARAATQEMAAANGTRNVTVLGICTPEWLVQYVDDGALIISDCEGFESQLFTPAVVSRLKRATLIIETHDAFVPGVSAQLRHLFSPSHVVTEIGAGGQKRESTLNLDFLSEDERKLASQEARGPQLWLLCTPIR